MNSETESTTNTVAENNAPCCCSCASTTDQSAGQPQYNAPWIQGTLSTAVGEIPKVSINLTLRDQLGAVKVRMGAGRMSYTVPAGLYAVGSPDAQSPVLVTANYKLTFDSLRKELNKVNAWLLVLDTEGINVWCAAGAGTFGTNELVKRIRESRVGELISHKQLIVPQLGAPGVSAPEVQRQTGFSVIYGPVRACDITRFIEAGYKAEPEMRRVNFDLRERAVVIPVELRTWFWYVVVLGGILALAGGIGPDGFSVARLSTQGVSAALAVLTGYVAGGIVTPLLLPWLPGRAFSTRGLVCTVIVGGLALWLLAASGGANIFSEVSPFTYAAWLLAAFGVGSFMALNYTGTSTFTSLSGVQKETRVALPLQLGCVIVALLLWIFV